MGSPDMHQRNTGTPMLQRPGTSSLIEPPRLFTPQSSKPRSRCASSMGSARSPTARGATPAHWNNGLDTPASAPNEPYALSPTKRFGNSTPMGGGMQRSPSRAQASRRSHRGVGQSTRPSTQQSRPRTQQSRPHTQQDIEKLLRHGKNARAMLQQVNEQLGEDDSAQPPSTGNGAIARGIQHGTWASQEPAFGSEANNQRTAVLDKLSNRLEDFAQDIDQLSRRSTARTRSRSRVGTACDPAGSSGKLLGVNFNRNSSHTGSFGTLAQERPEVAPTIEFHPGT